MNDSLPQTGAFGDVTAPWFDKVAPDDMRRIIETFYKVHGLIAVITDLDSLLESILEESKTIAQADACSLMLYDERRNDLYFQVALGEAGDTQKLKQTVRLRLDEGIAGAAASRQQCMIVENAQDDPRFYRFADQVSHFKTRNILAVPLVDRGNLVGVIEVLNKAGGGRFSEIDQRIMEMFASLVATVITNARLIEENIRKERLAATGQAVAGLSHYTKNILTGLQGSVDLINHGLERNDTAVLKKGWAVLRRGIDRISNVVEDMLAYSTPRRPAVVATRVKDVIDDVAADYADYLKQKQITLTIDCPEPNDYVHIDPRGLHRCLLNLITNAVDVVQSPGGRICVAAWRGAGGSLEIEVRDDGPGVPRDMCDKIFDPFYSTKGSSGTGLGLAVSQKIVMEHGGEIAVGESPEGGAAFHITIPQQESEA